MTLLFTYSPVTLCSTRIIKNMYKIVLSKFKKYLPYSFKHSKECISSHDLAC